MLTKRLACITSTRQTISDLASKQGRSQIIRFSLDRKPLTTKKETAIQHFAKLVATTYLRCPEVKTFVCDGVLRQKVAKSKQLPGLTSLSKRREIEFLLGTSKFFLRYDPREKTLYCVLDPKNQKLLGRITGGRPKPLLKPAQQVVCFPFIPARQRGAPLSALTPAQGQMQAALAKLGQPWATLSSPAEKALEPSLCVDNAIAIEGTELFLNPDSSGSFVIRNKNEVVGLVETSRNSAWLFPAAVLLLSENDLFALFLFLSQRIFKRPPSSAMEGSGLTAIEVDFSEPLTFSLPRARK